MHKIFGFSLIILLTYLSIIQASSFFLFIDIPSILFIIGMVCGYCIWVLGFKGIWLHIRAREKRVYLMDLISKSAGLAGVLAFVIALAQLSYNLDNFLLLGKAMAVAVLTMVYGFTIQFMSSCYKDSLQHELNSAA